MTSIEMSKLDTPAIHRIANRLGLALAQAEACHIQQRLFSIEALLEQAVWAVISQEGYGRDLTDDEVNTDDFVSD